MSAVEAAMKRLPTVTERAVIAAANARGFALRLVISDGERVLKLQCPGCQTWGEIDDDQLHGRISIDCPVCPYHETHNLVGTP